MRLIDADELITAFPCGESVRTESVRATINHMPTIPSTATDIFKALREAEYRGYMKAVAERPQGEWIFKKIFPNDDSEFPMGYLVCSVCGSQHANSTPCNYCDNCGAKMKEVYDE